jgi:serine/threonine protein kinase/Tfp pilus assembly protein PilF
MIGHTISHYRIVEKVGEGGMGVVYRAHDDHLNRDVAIKVLHAEDISDPSAMRQFRKEAEALSRLNHPNIATVFDFDTEAGTAFLAMELVTGPTLTERLAAGPLAEKEVARIGMQLAEALAAAHAQGVLHRDLKPGNLRFAKDGRLKVLDFGLAKLMEAEYDNSPTLTATDTVAGTLPYMSPEQVRGEPPDPRWDIYSAGAVLYEAATGQLVFSEKVPTRLVLDIVNRPAVAPRVLNSTVSPELERILLKCLDKEADNRYQSAQELLVDLRRLGRPLTDEASKPALQTKSLMRPMNVILALAALFTVLGYAAWHWTHRPRMPVASATTASVAVLPFRNLSADSQNEYFSEGTTEEIITKLSKISNLQVASRTSVARYKDTLEDAKQIGKELGVRFLLEGSVRKEQNRVRITAQLVDTSTGFHLWAEDFDKELKDVFVVQEETALKIAETLDLRLTPQEQQAVRHRYTQNAQAYDAYLRGVALVGQFDTPEKLEKGRQQFERALELDPEYGPALAGLATVEVDYYRNYKTDPAHFQRAQQLAERALTIDPQMPGAHVALGQVAAASYDYRRGAEEFRIATHLDPSDALAWDQLGWVLSYLQPPEAAEAEKASREAIRLGYETLGGYYHLARALLLQGRYDGAISALEHARTLSPNSSVPDYGLSQVYLAQGRYDQALSLLERQPPDQMQTAVTRFLLSSVYAAQGDRNNALTELKHALEKGFRDFAAIDASPYFNSLRSDTRFKKLLRQYRQ